MMLAFYSALQVISLLWSVDALCSPPTPTLPSQPTDAHSYITPNYGIPDGHQVIFTGAQFSCHGNVTSWSAIVAFDTNFIVLNHAIYMQVWRPGQNRTYHLVGSNYLLLAPRKHELFDLRPTNSQYRYFKFSRESSNSIPFQPGDVIGYFIPPLDSSAGARGAVSPLYRTDELGSMLVGQTPHPDSCEVVDCGGSVRRRMGVAPLVTVDYVTNKEMRSSPPPTCTVSTSYCCPFTAHKQIEALDDCHSTSFEGKLCHSLLLSSLHLQPSVATTFGHQVLFPDISFDCHGYIDSWSALTVLDVRFAQSGALLSHTIHLQVWRPVGKDGYRLVGSEQLIFDEGIGDGYRLQNSHNSYFVFSSESGVVTSRSGDRRIHFQPGDVIGCFIPARFRTLNPPLSIVYSVGEEGSRMFVGMSNGVRCEGSGCVRDVDVTDKIIPWISLKTVPVEVESQSSTHSTPCNTSFACPSHRLPLSDVNKSLPTQALRQTPSPNNYCTGGSCHHLSSQYGIFPILAFTVILLVASFSLFLCSVLFCYARKRQVPRSKAKTHSISQPILSNNSRDEMSSDDGRSASSCILRENSHCLAARSHTVSTEFGLDDTSTRVSNLLEFHAYPHYTHQSNSSIFKVSEV